MVEHTAHLETAIDLAYRNVRDSGGRPFGAVLTRDGVVVATGVNTMLSSGDPTAHAELEALRAAGRAGELSRPGKLVMYASGHPCPMCLAAMLMLKVDAVRYAYSEEEGRPYGLSTAHVYEELRRPLQELSLPLTHDPVRVAGADPYEAWRERAERS